MHGQVFIMVSPFLDLHFSVANGYVSSKIYDVDFDIVNFRFLDGDVLMVYTFRKLLGLLESAIMLQISTLEINV